VKKFSLNLCTAFWIGDRAESVLQKWMIQQEGKATSWSGNTSLGEDVQEYSSLS